MISEDLVSKINSAIRESTSTPGQAALVVCNPDGSDIGGGSGGGVTVDPTANVGDWLRLTDTSEVGPVSAGYNGGIPIFSGGSTLVSNINFGRDPATQILYNAQGFTVNAAATTVTRYVDPAGGDNNDNGLTAGTAWADANYALRQRPMMSSGIYRIEIAAGSHNQNIIVPEIIGNAEDTLLGNSIIVINGAGVGSTELTCSSGFVLTSVNARTLIYLDNLTLQGDGDAIVPATISGIRGSNANIALGNVNLDGFVLGISLSGSRFSWEEQSPAVVNSATNCDGVINSANGSMSAIRKAVDMSFKTNCLAVNSYGTLLLDGTKEYSFTGVGPNVNAGIQSSGGLISLGTGAAALDFEDVPFPYRVINGGVLAQGGGHTITLTDCANGLGQISEQGYFLEAVANTYVAAGTTPTQYTTNSQSLISSVSAIFNTSGGWTRLNTPSAAEKFATDFRYLSYGKGEHFGAPTPGVTRHFSRSGLVTTSVPLHIVEWPGHIQILLIASTVSNGSGNSDIYTVTVNGTPIAITATITDDVSGSATGNVFVDTGDLIGVQGEFDPATLVENIFVQVGIRRS